MASKDENILKRIQLIQSMDVLLNDMALVSNEQTTLRMEELKLTFEDEIKEYKSTAEWHWSPGKAFSVLSEVKKQDVLKRRKLIGFYIQVQEILEKCDEKFINHLDSYFGCEVKEEIKKKLGQLDVKEHTVLFAGEVSSGKSSLINLILGEEVLPIGLKAVTSTVCEIRYGEEKKMFIFYKDKDKEVQEMIIDESRNTTAQLKEFLQQENDRDKGSPVEKCELYWPHEILKEGVVIVDSPGVGESEAMTAAVTQYLEKAFCFVYVLDSSHAGGIQKDRIVRILKHLRELSGQHLVFESALFVCNKWDLVEKNDAEVDCKEFKQYMITELEKYWPYLDPPAQVVEFSTHNAALIQDKSCISEMFVKLMCSLKSLLLRTISAKLEAEWRWLDSILERMLFYTKAFIRNVEGKDAPQKYIMLRLVMNGIEEENKKIVNKIEQKIKVKTEHAIEKYSEYFASKGVKKKFATWNSRECPPEGEIWLETKSIINGMLEQRFIEMTERHEKESKIVSKVQKSLMKRLKKHNHDIKIQINEVEDQIINGEQFNEHSRFDMSVKKKVLVGLTSPVWIPVAAVAVIVGALPYVGWQLYKKSCMTDDQLSYYKSKTDYMTWSAEAFLGSSRKDEILRKFIEDQLVEIQKAFETMKKRIGAMILANKLLLDQFKSETRSLLENISHHDSIKYSCLHIRGELSIFALKDVLVSVPDESLDLDKSKTLGEGAFADVYAGVLKTPEGQTVEVAVKVAKVVLDNSNADQLLCEEKMLRKLEHKNVVKFYGRVLQDDDDGTRVLFIMELCQENLRSFLNSNPHHVPGKARSSSAIKMMLTWARDVASGLEYLHNQEIVHRDLKQENILVGLDNSLKIADVGISKPAIQITGTVVGTPIYMAPEVFESQMYDGQADIYSFGLILWEMWYGSRVFSELKEITIPKFIEKIKNGYRPQILIESLFPPMPDLQRLIEKCWPTTPKARLNISECVTEFSSIIDSMRSSEAKKGKGINQQIF